MSTNPGRNGAGDEVTIGELFQILWRGKWLVLAMTVGAVAIAGLAMLILPKRYDATVVLSPVTEDSGGALGALGGIAARLGGLGSLGDLASGGSGRKQEAIAYLQSRTITEAFIEDRNLLPLLFANRWDAANQRWKDGADVPTSWDGNDLFARKIRGVDENKLTGLVTLDITWRDAAQAADWANDLVARTNDYMRKKALDESDRNVAYLNKQADQINEVGLRGTIYALLEGELKKSMLARGNPEYAFRVIDAAVPAKKPSFPKPLILAAGAVAFGLLCSTVLLILRFLLAVQPSRAIDAPLPME